jgi:2-keto-4-pentenoate hydratase/2-oxohepta-3-ene-1,7-dioic acid hydratase in catechol pathway
MRLATFDVRGRTVFGVFSGPAAVIDLTVALRVLMTQPVRTMEELLGLGEEGMRRASEICRTAESRQGDLPAGSLLQRSEVTLRAPVLRPSKIIGIGLNYGDHCREQHVEAPGVPRLFAKYPSSVNGPGGVIRWDSHLTAAVDFEAELGVVIGARAFRISRRDALKYVAGYTVVNDVSARDLQFSDRQWVRGKSLDTFCPMGPVLVTRDEIPDPQMLAIRCTVNGVIVQNSNTSDMIFPVAELVEFITQGITLEPGDVIATGTPAGVGHFRTPPLYLKDGDEVVVSIGGVGELRNRCETIHS